jgi:hypothetical protein
VLNVEESDLAGLPLSVLAAMATIGSYYYLQPLGDVLALSMGLEWTPLITVGNMVLIVALNPLYAAAVLNLSTEAILPFMYRIVSALLLLFACFFYFFSGVKTLSFCFSVYVGTISLFTTTTFYARLASLHTKAEAKRVKEAKEAAAAELKAQKALEAEAAKAEKLRAAAQAEALKAAKVPKAAIVKAAAKAPAKAAAKTIVKAVVKAAAPAVKAWSCEDDGNAHSFPHEGKLYARNYTNDVWECDSAGNVVKWAGAWLPAENRIDETVAEPTYADE